jgi:class 3 adenylate cyclase/predicted ATPase
VLEDAIMDVAVWLRSLGFGRYEAAFRENDIDDTLLPRLTAEDLKELGVSSLGHRRKLLDAIAALCPDAGVAEPAAAAETTPTTQSVSAEERAERRQVTVMFSDLVGSTALSARMDPEDLREIISAYQKCVAETVQRFGGYVAKYMGDGVLVYFGYPQAHEHDAERAVRAGLALVTAVGKLQTQARLQTRVGIATGLVIVGDLIGSGASQEQAIVGETPNLAARLQGVAEPDSVVVAESTRKLVGNLFELRDLGGQSLKGIIGAVRAWAALRPASVESRFEALHASGLTNLVGREEELGLLVRRWAKAKNGEGQVVLISGEAGIGKSRLTAALMNSIASEPHARLRYFCSPQHTDSALYPIISQLERAAGFLHDDPPKVKLDKLDTVLARTAVSKEDAALFAEMMSLQNDGRHPATDLDPQQRRQKALAALTTQMEAIARQNPLLMIFEDAHWTDPTSLEAFGRTVDRIKQLRGLLIVTYRPEFEAPWVGRPYVSFLALNRLGESDVDAMIDRVIGNKALPANIRQDIIERTDGIPLFVEEMTKAVLEAGGEESAARTITAVPSPAAAVPPSLHGSLMARLDRLGPAKEIAQVGAAIGREFSHALLVAVARKPEAELQSALSRLTAAGLLFVQGMPPQATYLFKHALLQDAAYGTLLREPRRALHARIAGILERQFPDIPDNQPELLARHCAEANLIEKAAFLWGKAGLRSLARSALVEASEQLTRALAQLSALPASPSMRSEQIKLQVALINSLMHVKGFAAPETKAAIERARLLIEQAEALGEGPEDPLLLFSVLFGFWAVSIVAFNGDAVADLATQFLALAEKQQASVPLTIGHRMMGIALVLVGDLAKGRTHLDQAVTLYDPAQHRSLAIRFGQDAAVAIHCYRSIGLWLLGYPEAALSDAEQALSGAREIGQVGTLMFALFHTCLPHVMCGKYATARSLVDELTALAGQKGAIIWKAWAKLSHGRMFALMGDTSNAVETINSGIQALRSTGATTFLPVFLLDLARANAELGLLDDAWRCIDEAKATMDTGKERWCEAEVYRVAGEIALISTEPKTMKVEAYFERALAVARRQQAKSLELRAATSLARLWRDQGNEQQAREVLAPVYEWFTEGFDTRDLKDAKALLAELA